jgi:hypothetical protein
MSKSQHGKHVANVQRKIARHLNKGEPVPPGLAQALATLLRKEQRSRLGQLQNMRRRGGAALMRVQLYLNSHSSIVLATTTFVAVQKELF